MGIMPSLQPPKLDRKQQLDISYNSHHTLLESENYNTASLYASYHVFKIFSLQNISSFQPAYPEFLNFKLKY